MHKQYKWFKIVDAENELTFSENNLRVLEINNKKITLAKHNDQLFACAYTCPHASGILADGYLDGMGNIVCPVHRYKFNLLNGRNISGEGYYLKTYPLKKNEEGIFIGFEKRGFFDFL
jgi:3-phenylpropionate/trans-cinnamate dioxygenase ferredoxin subunit